ncbi:MAG: M20 family metallo-hydrolase [Anaerolineaceae bacterium]|nr:M20 family metallo-hydrolase [Anaerolineaceae bacterium]
MQEITDIRVNADRLLVDLQDLAQIGKTDDGGVTRISFSDADLQARAWFQKRVLQAGLKFHQDGAGNLFARFPDWDSQSPALLLGSHMDTVLNGGKYDGALGSLSALEVMRTIQEWNMKLPINLEAVVFSDEEGNLMNFLGSSALTGQLSNKTIEESRVGKEQLLIALQNAGLNEEGLFAARREKKSLAGYLEVHIEQGNRLLKAQAQVGVVNSIVGIRSYRVQFLGRADHAGTMSMKDRRDAAQGAAALITKAHDLVLQRYPEDVCTVGWVNLVPGTVNVIPERAELTLEFRSANLQRLDNMDQDLILLIEELAAQLGLSLKMEKIGDHRPAEMSPLVRQSILEAVRILNLTSIEMSSGAAHDAQMLAAVCATGLIFVPSEDGASHSPREYTRDEDCVNAANLLLHTALKMIQGGLNE